MNALLSGTLLAQMPGYGFPNEKELQWSMLIVVYPYVTGLVAGAFILASLVRIFDAKAVAPVYRLALLTALAFLLCAPLPLVSHLGHPERAFEIMFTPHLSSAMAVFGFVYLWYLMGVLLLEVWFDFRKDIVLMSQKTRGLPRLFYNILTLGVKDISEKAVHFDERAGYYITTIGIPSAVLLHGYVGFIFGSLKSNPWWSSPLMPVIFLLSAIVSGVAVVLLIYITTTHFRKKALDVRCVDAIGRYLMFSLIFDLTFELLDMVHRMYEAGESFQVLNLLNSGYLFHTIFGVQLFFGGLVPLSLLASIVLLKPPKVIRIPTYTVTSILTLIGVLSMRWNVVIGGQLFSKSFRGMEVYKLQYLTLEGFLGAVSFLVLPIVILFILVKILPPWPEAEPARAAKTASEASITTEAVA